VLIVEDEAPLVTMLRYNLEREGFAVEAATDGEEALLRIAERRPDAVLLDWMLPLVSGLGLPAARKPARCRSSCTSGGRAWC
jgi:two-component system, OmpR family, phosphate regulon response regulator PhoB